MLVRWPLLTYLQIRIVEMCFRDDRTNEELARRLGKGKSTVVRLKRAATATMVKELWPEADIPLVRWQCLCDDCRRL